MRTRTAVALVSVALAAIVPAQADTTLRRKRNVLAVDDIDEADVAAALQLDVEDEVPRGRDLKKSKSDGEYMVAKAMSGKSEKTSKQSKSGKGTEKAESAPGSSKSPKKGSKKSSKKSGKGLSAKIGLRSTTPELTMADIGLDLSDLSMSMSMGFSMSM